MEFYWHPREKLKPSLCPRNSHLVYGKSAASHNNRSTSRNSFTPFRNLRLSLAHVSRDTRSVRKLPSTLHLPIWKSEVNSNGVNLLSNTTIRWIYIYIYIYIILLHREQLYVSALDDGHLQVVHESVSSYTNIYIYIWLYNCLLSDSCTTWRWPLSSAETCSCSLCNNIYIYSHLSTI